jgi:uncharacterized protein (DUF952 family)
VILHITDHDQWARARRTGELRPASLAETGFVHCSDPGTVHLPANALYAGRTDLLLLSVDPGRVGAPVRWEPADPPAPGMPWFPHVYGPIPVTAVLGEHEFRPDSAGRFVLPQSMAEFRAT